MTSSTICTFLVQAFLLYTRLALAKQSTSTSSTTSTITVAYRTTTTTVAWNKAYPTSKPESNPYSTSDFKAAVLNSTNYFRTQFLAVPLTWDANLAQYAQSYASKCVWDHSGGPYGENLAEGFATPTLAVEAWASEEREYIYPNEGFSENTGHFTQLVWQNTTHLGCGAVNCDNHYANGARGWFVVCEYSPPGNVDGEYLFNVQKPGESDDGKLGFGSMSSLSPSNRCSWLLATVASMGMLAARLI